MPPPSCLAGIINLTSPAPKPPSAGLARHLIVILAGLLLVTLASAGMAVYLDRQNREAVALAQITRVAEQMVARLDRFFNPVAEDLLLIRQWSQNGSLEDAEPQQLAAKFSPLLRNHSQVYAFIGWTDERLSFMLVRDGEGLLLGHATGDANSLVWSWKTLDAGETITQRWQETGHELETPLGAWLNAPELADRDQITWHQTGTLPPAGLSGIFAATGWQTENRRQVAAAGLLNTQIVQLLDDIRSGASYRFFLFGQNGLFIDFQRLGASDSPTSSSPQDPVMDATYQAWQQRGEIDGAFGFDHAGARVYALVHGLQGSRRQAGIGIIASKDDLLRHLPLNRFFFVPAVLGVLWLVVLALALRLGRSARGLSLEKPLQSMTETQLCELIQGGETDRVEFKSTLRWNLRSGKAGKEIELASLKTVAAFMNTDGGTLLVGVGDDGTVSGIAADNLPNDDKYLRHFSTIFEQHIGLTFSEFIDFVLLPIAGKQVLVVRCRRSPRPVFVTHKKDEMFFIRSGPSSRQLNTRQVIAYLEERNATSDG